MNLKSNIRDYVFDKELKIEIKDKFINILNYSKIDNISDKNIRIENSNRIINIDGKKIKIIKLLDDEILINGIFDSINFKDISE